MAIGLNTGLGLTGIAHAGRLAATPFNPASLFGANDRGVFFDVSAAGSRFIDSAGATPATTAGDPVGRLNDLSPTGYHISQATSANRPTLTLDAGGLPCLQFDGTNDCLFNSANLDLSNSDKVTIVAAFTKVDNTARIALELSNNAGSLNNTGAFYLVAGTDAGFASYSSLGRGTAPASPSQSGASSSAPTQDIAVIRVQHDIAGDLGRMWRNGLQQIDGTGDKGSGNFGAWPLFVGSRNNSALYYNGRIYALLIINRLLTAGESAQVDQWMAAKCGVTL